MLRNRAFQAGLIAAAVLAIARAPRLAAGSFEPAPMRELLARGVGTAPVDSGLSFALTITDGGRSTVAGPWALRVPGVSRPLKLSLTRVHVESGYLEAAAHLQNDCGVFLGGLRLDFLEISQGTPVPTNAPALASAAAAARPLALDSPLYFGDLAPGNDAVIAFRVGPLDLVAGSPYAVLRGVVTGAALAATIEVKDSSDPSAIDSDGQGRVYVGDAGAQAIFRLGPEANSQRKIPAGCPITGIAVRRKTGEVDASCREAQLLLRLPSNGPLTRMEPIGRALGSLRYGGKGKGFLYGLYGASPSIVRIDGSSIVEDLAASAGQPLRAAGFDVDPQGTVWAVTTQPEGKLLRIRTAHDIFAAAGPGNGLGVIAAAQTCRVGPDGAIYVLEGPQGTEPPRVSVFDSSGNFLRTWALPAKAPVDLAFGTESRLLVLSKRENGRAADVEIFRLF